MIVKNKKSRLVIVILLVSLGGNIVLGVALRNAKQLQSTAEIRIENNYQRNFLKLRDDVEQIKLQLAQVLVTADDEQLLLGLANWWRAVYGAINSMDALPLPLDELSQTESFLRDAAEYSYYLIKQQLSPGVMDSDDWDKLAEFYHRSKVVRDELDKIQSRVLNENWHFSTTEQDKSAEVLRAFQGIEEKIAAFPVIELEEGVRKIGAKIRPIAGDMVSESEALAIAADFCAAFLDGEYVAKLEYKADNATIPIYGVRLNRKGAEAVYIEISQRGGHILQMYQYPTTGKAEISAEAAMEIAVAFLERMDFHDLVVVDEMVYDNSCDLTLVPLDEGVYLYTDMLKVMVSLNSGEVMSFDQSSYITHHYERMIDTPKISQAQIAGKMNPNFQIEEFRLALISDEYSEGEYLCYEVRGEVAGEKYAVFVDANSGEERRIVRLENATEYEFKTLRE